MTLYVPGNTVTEICVRREGEEDDPDAVAVVEALTADGLWHELGRERLEARIQTKRDRRLFRKKLVDFQFGEKG